MDVTASQIEEIVRQVVQSMGNGAGSAANTADLPKVAHCAMLVAPKKFEVKEIPIPELTDDDILVRVEGAGVCGTDVHEWRQDPFWTYSRRWVTREPARWCTSVRTSSATPPESR